MKKVFFGFLAFAAIFLANPVGSLAQETEKVRAVNLYLFHSELCPHCKEEIKFLGAIRDKYPELAVYHYELSKSFKNRNIFEKVVEHYGLSGGVPVTIIGEEVIVGFDDASGIGKQIEEAIAKCQEKTCESWTDQFQSSGLELEGKKTDGDKGQETLGSSVFSGKLSLEKHSTLFLGTVLGLADGINPCMFSVLIFLLTYLVAVGSKKRAVRAGIAFIATTFVVYFLFMLGIIKVISVLNIAAQARLLVTLFALIAGLIMIKDYFFYGKWISLSIPENFKPKIESLVKKGTVPSAIFLALLSSIVELPCTSGIPLAYISVISSRGLNPFWNLAVYNFFFVVPLILIVMGVVFAWTKIERLEDFRQKYRRHMRLAAGSILLILAFMLWKNLI